MAYKKVLCYVLKISVFLALAGVLAVAFVLKEKSDDKNDTSVGSSVNVPESAVSICESNFFSSNFVSKTKISLNSFLHCLLCRLLTQKTPPSAKLRSANTTRWLLNESKKLKLTT